MDFVWSKGAINCAWVNETRGSLKNMLRRFDFTRWVRAVKGLLAPGGVILLMPAMGEQPLAIRDDGYDLETRHWCPDLAAFERSYFCATMRGEGFQVVRDVPGYTQPLSFPLGFVYR